MTAESIRFQDAGVGFVWLYEKNMIKTSPTAGWECAQLI